MNQITKIIIGLVGIVAIGLITYYVVHNEAHPKVVLKPVPDPKKDTVATAKLIVDSALFRISDALGIDGKEYTSTGVEGIYTNSTKDKVLVIKEDIWKEMIQKIQKKLPHIAKDCAYQTKMPDLKEYNFIGLLTYLASSKNTKITTGYTATEIRKGNAISFAGGDICCHCEGEALVPQQVDGVVIK